MSNKLLKKHYNGHCLYRVIPDPRYLTLLTDGNGTLVANKTSGYSGDIISLTATPTAYSASFNRYEITGAILSGNDFAFQGEDVTAKAYFNVPIVRTLTLQTDGHGTLTADKVTGYVGQTVTLTPTYNTYYRFKNYQNTGGSINGNTFTFSDADATVKANFSANVFTASGNFTTGRGWSPAASGYAITSYRTNNVPASWYATSNRWNPSNASGYNITFSGTLGYNRMENSVAGAGSTNSIRLYNNTTLVTALNGALTGNYKGYTLVMIYSGENLYTSTRQGNWTVTVSYSPQYGQYGGCTAIAGCGSATSLSSIWSATGYAP